MDTRCVVALERAGQSREDPGQHGQNGGHGALGIANNPLQGGGHHEWGRLPPVKS
jgi:hypothetical protein